MLKRGMAFSVLSVAAAAFLLAPSGQAKPESAPRGTTLSAGSAATVLDMERFKQLVKVEEKLAGVLTRDLRLEMALATSGDHDSIARWLRRIEDNSDAASAIREAGMSTGDYLNVLIALFRATSVAEFHKQGLEVPGGLESSVPAENLAFVRKHETEISGWMNRTGKPSISPNTIEDLYAQPPPSPSPEKP